MAVVELGSRFGGLGNSPTIPISQAVVSPVQSPTRSEYLCGRTFLSQWNVGFNFSGTRVLVPVQNPAAEPVPKTPLSESPQSVETTRRKIGGSDVPKSSDFGGEDGDFRMLETSRPHT